MSDGTSNGEQATAQAPVPTVRMLGQFIKDLSFEVPHAPEIFTILRQSPPDIPIGIDVSMRHVSDTTYEVTVSTNIEATAAGKPAFILELAYGCLVDVNEAAVPNEAIHPMLMMEVPRQIFPFVRQIVADMTVGGGFPPLLLQMVDFADLYRRKYGVPVQPVEQAPPAGASIN